WRTAGNNVWLGHLHVVPVGAQLLYMEAVFLAATDQAIPDLRRFVVSDGQRVAMEPTLEEAIARLAGDRPTLAERDPDDPGLSGVAARDTSRWPSEALDLLDLAESRLRSGDWNGFGTALEQLRQMLQRLEPGP